MELLLPPLLVAFLLLGFVAGASFERRRWLNPEGCVELREKRYLIIRTH